MIVALRRSSGSSSSRAAGAAGAAVAPNAVPHSMQNLAPGGFSAPQLGQAAENPVPHDMQNLALSGLAAPQLGQFMAPGYGRSCLVDRDLLDRWALRAVHLLEALEV